MKTNAVVTLIRAANIRRWILLAVLSCSTFVSAQGVLSGSQTGTLEDMRQGDGFLTISGRNYDYHNDITEVFYDGQKVRTLFLNEGLVVRFVLNRDGILSRIEVLGPVDMIEALEES